jgi:sulfhydrogenase subunit alpha
MSGRIRTIRTKMLARVEGEGALDIKLKGERVTGVQLRLFEPPRFFEALLRGRHYSEAADITARICGICPVAYQMSAVHAIERALGIRIDPAVRLLRRLFYCGEWIESHTLHVYLLHAPDFLGFEDAIAMARDHRELVEQALHLKKVGNRIVALLGGREIHPVSASVGGFYKVPAKSQLRELEEDLKWAVEASVRTVKLVSGFEFPDFEQDYEFVALSHPNEYPFNEGRIVSNLGLNIDADEYEAHFPQHQVDYSTALHSSVRGRGSYLVGPLARFNLNFEKLPAVARAAAIEASMSPPVRNPFRSIVVRGVEILFACLEAMRIVQEYEPPSEARVAAPPCAGAAQAVTEAPRGILYHQYVLDEKGIILDAKIVAPTAQNQKRIEDDLYGFVPRVAAKPLKEATWKCEQAIRNYDPCISCSTHFLRLHVERN